MYTMHYTRTAGFEGVGHKGLYLSPDRLPQIPNQSSGSSARVRTLRYVPAGMCCYQFIVLVAMDMCRAYVKKPVWQWFPEWEHYLN